MAVHRLQAGIETIHWGVFSAGIAPVLTVESGDTVTIETISGPPEVLPAPEAGFVVPEALLAFHAAGPKRLGPHMLTGPVAVRGAVPGDMLEVRIDAIELGSDWGYCGHRPLAGTLPDDFSERFLSHIAIDRAARTCRLPWGMELALRPFFGVMGVAPRAGLGELSTKEPRAHGGNLDNKELVAGSTLFLPVFVEGARFSVGDGHGVQGDGEVCINALETSLTGIFTLVLHKGGGLRYPRAETPTHYVSMGMNEDLDEAMRIALREMIGFIVARTGLGRDEAYQLCSLAVGFRVTQTVNGEKGIHGMLRRELVGGSSLGGRAGDALDEVAGLEGDGRGPDDASGVGADVDGVVAAVVFDHFVAGDVEEGAEGFVLGGGEVVEFEAFLVDGDFVAVGAVEEEVGHGRAGRFSGHRNH